MGFAEDVARIRLKFADAVKAGVFESENSDIVLATYIQIMNEAEKNKQSSMAAIETWKQNIANAQGQVNVWSSIGSMVFNVLNGYVQQAEKAAKEAAEREAERESAEFGSVDEIKDDEELMIMLARSTSDSKPKKTRKRKSATDSQK